ncbi:MAG: hypothetical protein KAJ10_08540, partial [Thermodesulfovibrionia bacterium]|nr:hypothetical protein [Thermodesulfovibrionia bacterium]
NGDRAPKQEILASGSKMYSVPLGTHIDINYTFEIPKVQEWFVDFIDVELIARKKGEVKFRETIRFHIRNMQRKEFEGESSKVIVLSDTMQPKY